MENYRKSYNNLLEITSSKKSKKSRFLQENLIKTKTVRA